MHFDSNNSPADGNGNGVVVAADYVIWRKNFGATGGTGAKITGTFSGARCRYCNNNVKLDEGETSSWPPRSTAGLPSTVPSQQHLVVESRTRNWQ